MKALVMMFAVVASVSAQASSFRTADPKEFKILEKVGTMCPYEFVEAMKGANKIASVQELGSMGPNFTLYNSLVIQTEYSADGVAYPVAELIISEISSKKGNEMNCILNKLTPQTK